MNPNLHILSLAVIALMPQTASLMPSLPQTPDTQAPPPRTQTPPVPPPVVLPPPTSPPPTSPPPGTQPRVIFDKPVTAEEAAQIALRFQPVIAAFRGQVTAAQGRTEQARSGLLPQVGVSAGYSDVQVLNRESTGAATNPIGGGNLGQGVGGAVVQGFNSTLTVRQLLFDFNRTRDLTRQARAFERAAEQILLQTQNDVVLQVKNTFYAYQQALRLVRVSEENVANRQNQLDLANARFQSGLGQPLDVVTAETARADAVIALTTARRNAEITRTELAQSMGLDPQTPVEIAQGAEPGTETSDVNALVTTALTQRPEVRQAEENVAAGRFGVSAARVTNAPVISGNLGFGARGTNIPPGNDTFFVGLSVGFTPFDGGLTSGRVREARGTLDTAQANLETARLNVRGEVARAFVVLRTAEQNVVTAQANVANARENVRIAEGRYRTGLGQFLDIINAQAFLFTAQTNLTTAERERDQARAALRRALGQPFAAPPPVR